MNQKLKKVWKNRKAILTGLWNKVFPKPKIEEIAEYRLDICRSNYCGKYDKYGTSPEAVLPGYETCGQCGCNLSYLTRVMEENCSLKDIGKEPLWTAETRYKNEE